MYGPISQVSDDDLKALRQRLRTTRWPRKWPNGSESAGVDEGELRRLVGYWANDFDWRSHEARINALPSTFAEIDGTKVHYVHLAGETADAFPIVLTHGWPSSFLELTELGSRLANPSQYGGSASDAFTVIIPSLPGFAYSEQRPEPSGDVPTHELWHILMRDHLGFERYGAHGGDLGAGVTSLLGAYYPEEVAGIHLLAVRDPAEQRAGDVTPEEHAYLAQCAEWFDVEGGYEHLQRTKPMTLSYGLSDSPTGLLAWILEKYRAWTDGDGLPAAFSDDFVLTQASIYWFTNSISTSFRPYFEYRHDIPSRPDYIEVPTALAVFPADLVQPPLSWAERTYNVRQYTRMTEGGHFAALEVPAALAHDITRFFSTIRP